MYTVLGNKREGEMHLAWLPVLKRLWLSGNHPESAFRITARRRGAGSMQRLTGCSIPLLTQFIPRYLACKTSHDFADVVPDGTYYHDFVGGCPSAQA